jgi:hypothetical protein
MHIHPQPSPREPLYELFCVRKTDLWSRDGPRSRRPRKIFEGNLNGILDPAFWTQHF